MAEGGEGGERSGLRVLPGGGAGARDAGAAGRLEPEPDPVRGPGHRTGGPSDDALARRVAAGDDDAFGELVRRHEGLVVAVLRRYADRPDDARDLAQRAFLKAFQAARRAAFLRRGPVPFRAWLLRIAVNLGKNHLRDARRWPRASLAALDAERAVEPVGTAALERSERASLLRRAVLALPRRQREVLTLRVDAELPFAEIAAALGITENSAKVSFHHAVVRLRALAAAEPAAAPGAGEVEP